MKNKILKFDLFAHPVEMHVKGVSRVGTVCGFCLTILYTLAVLAYFGFNIAKVFNKE